METDLGRRTIYCHWCERVTDHVDTGDETVTRDGVACAKRAACTECGAENLLYPGHKKPRRETGDRTQ